MSSITSAAEFQGFQRKLQTQWQADFAMRQKHRSLTRTSRLVFGLGAVVDRKEAVTCVGNFFPNDAVSWFAIRDIPAGRFSNGRGCNGHTVNYASIIKAAVKFGMPSLDFTAAGHDSWDFSNQPFDVATRKTHGWRHCDVVACGDVINTGDRPNDIAVFNAISAEMTKMAYFGVYKSDRYDRRPDPVNLQWFKERPRRDSGAELFDVSYIRDWMPEPYLLFDTAATADIFDHSAEKVVVNNRFVFECPKCGHLNDMESLMRSCVAGDKGSEILESGDAYFAECLSCGANRKWHREDAVPVRVRRYFTDAFGVDFAAALLDGLPIRINRQAPSVYSSRKQIMHGRMKVVVHNFVSRDGDYSIVLPASADILVPVLSELNAGQVFAKAVPVRRNAVAVSRERYCRGADWQRWQMMSQLCGGGDYVDLLMRVWFDAQAAVFDGCSLYPARYAAPAVKTIESGDIYWSFEAAEDYYNPECKAYVFPPMPTPHWNRFRYSVLDGTVNLDLGVGDPRFVEADRPVRQLPKREPVSITADDEEEMDELPDLSGDYSVRGKVVRPVTATVAAV